MKQQRQYNFKAVLMVFRRYRARGLTSKECYYRLARVVGGDMAGMAYLIG